MKILVTGSAGHLGEALVRTLRPLGHQVLGVDLLASPYTDRVGSIADRSFVHGCMRGVEVVLHAATLHKPHVVTHSRQQFLDTNVSGTLNLLEEAVLAKVHSFIFTSTTSVFGRALCPAPDQPAAWITEAVVPVPRNIYGVTKAAAEDLCELFHRDHRLPVLVLRTSRFFAEEDDHKATREAYSDDNAKANEFLYRRVELEDAVSAHLCAIERAPALGFGRYIVSATTPFAAEDLLGLQQDAPAVVQRYFPRFGSLYRRLGWKMFPRIDRVYVNARARRDLLWTPRHDFAGVLERLSSGSALLSTLARAVGAKGYHPQQRFAEGPYPVACEG